MRRYSAVTKSKSIPNAGIKRLKFYIRDEAASDGSGVRLVPFKFKTTGGDCRNLVASQLKQLFVDVGVPPEFRWEAGDWENDPDNAENAQNRGDEAVAVGAPSMNLQPVVGRPNFSRFFGYVAGRTPVATPSNQSDTPRE